MSEPATDLCTECGLCCSGALFDFVAVEDTEKDRLTALGLPVRAHQPSGSRFDQPCPRFDGALCTIYQDRPNACRQFRCKVLIAVEAGAIDRDRAQALIADAKALLDEARALYGNDRPLRPQSWRELIRNWNSDGARTQVDPALLLQMTRLNHFLDVHFRPDSERVLHEKE